MLRHDHASLRRRVRRSADGLRTRSAHDTRRCEANAQLGECARPIGANFVQVVRNGGHDDSVAYESSDGPGENNPAGRVLAFLRPLGAEAEREPNTSAMAVAARMLGEDNESARTYLLLTRLRVQAESVPDLLEPYADDFGYVATFKHYGQILDAVKRLQTPAGQRATDIFTSVNDAGWAALEYAAAVLGHHHSEPVINGVQRSDYIDQVRGLIDEIIGDATLSAQDRSRIVDLLRKVEQALLDVTINGALPVEEAVAATAAVVRATPDLWERVADKRWMKRFGAVLVGIFMALEATTNVLAIEQYFSNEPQQVTVVQTASNGNGEVVHGEVEDHGEDPEEQRLPR